MAKQPREEELQELYAWIDNIPLSRRKKNLPRDFSDAVLMAEVIAYFFPRLVELHNYDQGLKIETKVYNWKTLNNRVLKKLNYTLDTETINQLANSTPGTIERVLMEIRKVMENKKEQDQHPFVENKCNPINEEIERARTCTDRRVLEQKMKEVAQKGKRIKQLEERIEKIEELIRMKDGKIQQLAGARRRTAAAK